MSLKTEVDNENTCRLCGNTYFGMMQSVFEIVEFEDNNIQLAEILVECASIQISKEDGLPTNACEKCINDLQNSYLFKKRCEKNNKTLTNKMLCLFCYRFFNDTKNLIKHHRLHINNKSLLKCNICEKMFENASLLNSHLEKHNLYKFFNCKLCDKFYTFNSVNEHLFYHDIDLERFDDVYLTYKNNFIGDNFIEFTLDNLYLDYELIFDDFKFDDCSDNPESVSNFTTNSKDFEIDVKSEFENSEIFSEHEDNGINKIKINIKTKKSFSKKKRKNKFEKFNDTSFLNLNVEQKINFTEQELQRLECDHCGKKYENKRKYCNHRRFVLKSLEYKCELCNKAFAWASKLQRHIEQVHKKPLKVENVNGSFKCDQCDINEFSDINEYNEHKRKHKLETHCSTCNLTFTNYVELKDHRVSLHNFIEKENKYQCKTCMKMFTTEKYRDIHEKIHSDCQLFQCDVCNKKLVTKHHLIEHKRTHDKSRESLCNQCGKKFANPSSLSIHIRRHLGIKPYACRYCSKAFPRGSDLAVHLKRHRGEKNYACTYCDKRFVKKDTLDVHLRVHTGEKPFKCKYCDAAFTQAQDKRAHTRTHTGDKFECSLCGEGFIRNYQLNQHKFKAHGIEYKRTRVVLDLNQQAKNIEKGFPAFQSGNSENQIIIPEPNLDIQNASAQQTNEDFKIEY